VRAQADAAHPDHFVCDVDQCVAAEHPTPVRGQRLQVVVEGVGEQFLFVLGQQSGDQRWLDDDRAPACHLVSEAR
jgi:hypothetical protein